MRTAILDLVYVGLGGFIGSIGRYLAAGAVHQIFPGLAELRNLLSPEMRMFLLIGMLGGFTTFSTFGHETVALMRDGQFFHAVGNVLIQVIIGLSGVWLGYNVTRYI
jgi:CrcB protein